MAWYSIKDEGIVLRAFPWREYDRRYRILTHRHGKIDCIGRGAQKEKAKLAPALEPFAIVDIEIVRGRKSTTIISVEKKKRFWDVMHELDKRLAAQTSLQLLDRFTQEYDPDPDLYALASHWLHFLNECSIDSHTRSTFLIGGFLLRLLEHFGYQTQLRDCINCRQKVRSNEYKWHGGKGGLICSNCIKSDDYEWFAARLIGDDVITLLRFARSADLSDLMKPALSGAVMSDFANIIHDLVTFHIPGASDLPFWRGILHDVPLEEPVNYG